MRIMALDIGEARIGVALSDVMGWTAQPLEVIERKKTDAITRILALIAEHEVEEILVGLPLNMNGSSGPMAEKIRSFIEELGKLTDITITEWDERLSTVSAERVLIEADVSRKKRKLVIDKLAASVILQNYLDYRSR